MIKNYLKKKNMQLTFYITIYYSFYIHLKNIIKEIILYCLDFTNKTFSIYQIKFKATCLLLSPLYFTKHKSIIILWDKGQRCHACTWHIIYGGNSSCKHVSLTFIWHIANITYHAICGIIFILSWKNLVLTK